MASVLILDDEELVRRSIRRALERVDHHVEEAGEVAEARLALSRASFDVLLCDINLRGESGLDLVRQAASELPDTAVVMVTGVDDPEVADEAVRIGASGYLVKPFGPNELLINVLMALHRRNLERERRSYLTELETKILRRSSALQQAVRHLERAEASTRLAERETVDRLIVALTLRSEETGAHIQRMSRYGALLAAKRGIEEWSYDEFRIAAMLHDVGKIGVPDTILLKPGKLSEREYDIIKRHPDLGAALLSDGQSRILLLGAQIALTHHERWDGRGYPNGLAGEAIPLEGRIGAVADAFDAMTSHRVYQAAMSPERAVEILHAERGRQFDPGIVDLFLESLDEVLAIRDEYGDQTPVHGIGVLIVEARQLFADAVARLVMDADGLTVVASVASVEDALRVTRDREPDVIVIDAELPDGDGVAAVGALLAERPDAVALLLHSRDDDRIVRRALDAGCAGVLLRDHVFEELATAIAAAYAGERVLPPSKAAVFRGRAAGNGHASRLTRREIEVLQFLAEGRSNRAIAEELALSISTVRNHVQSALGKLNAHSRLEAVATAVRRGIVTYP